MTEQAQNDHIFTIDRPENVPTFSLYGKVFGAGAATGGDLGLLQNLTNADESVEGLKAQCSTLTEFLSRREIDATEPLPENWVWDTLPSDQIAQLAEQLVKAFEKQWAPKRKARRAKAA